MAVAVRGGGEVEPGTVACCAHREPDDPACRHIQHGIPVLGGSSSPWWPGLAGCPERMGCVVAGVLWSPGESHESGSGDGMTVVIAESDEPLPPRYRGNLVGAGVPRPRDRRNPPAGRSSWTSGNDWAWAKLLEAAIHRLRALAVPAADQPSCPHHPHHSDR